MRKNASKVFSLWLSNTAGKGDSKNTISTDGTTIYSYAMPLLVKRTDGTVLLCKRGDTPSVTTSCQRSALAVALDRAGIKFSEVSARDVSRQRTEVDFKIS